MNIKPQRSFIVDRRDEFFDVVNAGDISLVIAMLQTPWWMLPEYEGVMHVAFSLAIENQNFDLIKVMLEIPGMLIALNGFENYVIEQAFVAKRFDVVASIQDQLVEVLCDTDFESDTEEFVSSESMVFDDIDYDYGYASENDTDEEDLGLDFGMPADLLLNEDEPVDLFDMVEASPSFSRSRKMSS